MTEVTADVHSDGRDAAHGACLSCEIDMPPKCPMV